MRVFKAYICSCNSEEFSPNSGRVNVNSRLKMSSIKENSGHSDKAKYCRQIEIIAPKEIEYT